MTTHSARLLRWLNPYAAQPVAVPTTGTTNGQCDAQLGVLDKFTLDITAKARAQQIYPVLGREVEIRQMIDILLRPDNHASILIGEPGVGKNALVEGLALRISEGKVPDRLKAVSVRRLDLTLLQAGAGIKDECEQRLKSVINAVQQSPTQVLLFIDHIHTFISVGKLAGDTIRTIGAASASEFKQYLAADDALGQHCQIVNVDEPDDETTCLMLRGLKSRYASDYGVHIQDEAVNAAVTLSRRYLTGCQLPEKAIDVLDNASARVCIRLDTEPDALVLVKAQLATLKREQSEIEQGEVPNSEVDPARLADISDHCELLQRQQTLLERQYQQEHKLVQQLLALRQDRYSAEQRHALQQQLTALQGINPLLSLDVDAHTVATVIADWTGRSLNPLEALKHPPYTVIKP